MPEDSLTARVGKLDALRGRGIDPYPHIYEPTHRVPELVADNRDDLDVKVAGRIMASRKMGKGTFLDIVDKQARIQVLLRSDELGPVYDTLSLLDLGDFIGIEGVTFRTKTGQYSVKAKGLHVLAKSLQPLPDKWSGLKDPETRYSQRSLDLIANPEVAQVFIKRANAIKAMRQALDSRGYTEVEIPLLQPVYGGASAKPFITHVNDLDRDYFLSISPEIYLKRLVVGGLDVYTITKNFRNEGIDKTHNPEFTMMECYKAYEDYKGMMKLTEEMIAFMAMQVNGSTSLAYQGTQIELSPPWKRLPMLYGVEEATGLKADSMSEGQLKDAMKSRPDLVIPDYEVLTKGKIIIELFDKYVAPTLVQPIFVTDHPIESTPLCKPHRDNPELIERFEPYIAGVEIGNAYTELNDPILQRKLFEDQIRREGADNPYLKLDEQFLRALEHGMPPTGGLGIGVDRVVMLLANQPTLKDVLFFPMTKAAIR